MRLLLVIMMFMLSCYNPQKAWYDFTYVQLREICKSEIGYDLVWEKHDGGEYRQFIRDTSGMNLHIGVAYLIIVKR